MKDQIKNINLIFWGVIIAIIDFNYSWTTNGEGYKFDIVNDFFGSVMILLGLLGLSQIRLEHKSYSLNMRVCGIVSFIYILISFSEFFIYIAPAYVEILLTFINVIIDFSFIVFSGAMIMLCSEVELEKSLRWWKTARKLLLWVYFLPFAVPDIISEVISITQENRFDWKVEFGFDGIIFTLLFLSMRLTPIVYGLFTMHAMKLEIKSKL